MRKRILSIITALAMCFSMLPTWALAVESPELDGLCPHHRSHTPECGYTEGMAGTPCNHEHTDDCYSFVTECVHEHGPECYPQEEPDSSEDVLSDGEESSGPDGSGDALPDAEEKEPTECTHICSEKSGCIKKELNCKHEHDSECGYAPATEGTPCGYVCVVCPVQELIDALPDADSITVDNAEAVTAQLEMIDEAAAGLSGEDRAALDFSRYETAAMALLALTDNSNVLEGTGAFTVTYGAEGTDYSYADGVLTILTGAELTISGSTTADKIVVGDNVNANITFSSLSIQLSSDNACAFMIPGTSSATITLVDSNKLKSGRYYAGLSVVTGGSVTIKGDGSLHSTGGNNAAGIGGGHTFNAGTINIESGTITAVGGSDGAGIGGGHANDGQSKQYGRFDAIKITGGVIDAYSPGNAAAIGTGCWASTCPGEITIENAQVTAKTDGSHKRCAAIGRGISDNDGNYDCKVTVRNSMVSAQNVAGKGNSISGENGTPAIQDSIVQVSAGSTNDGGPILYGSYTLSESLTVPEGRTFSIGSGSSLTLSGDAALINNGTVVCDGNLSGSIANNGAINCGGIISGDVTNNGTIDCNGTVSGSVVNDGTISLGGGTLTVDAYSGSGKVYKNSTSTIDGPASESVSAVTACIAGDFRLSPDSLSAGKDYTFANHTLTVLTSAPITITPVTPGASTADRIVIGSGATANVTIEGLSINTTNGNAILLGKGSTLNLTLSDTNTLKPGQEKAGICVSNGTTLNISGAGSLDVTGGRGSNGGAGIGADKGGSVGTINISGGTIKAHAEAGGGAGIGKGGWGGSGGSISITGGYVISSGRGDEKSFAIDNNSNIQISGAVVEVSDDKLDGAQANDCLILKSGSGTVKGSFAMPCDLTIAASKTVTVPEGASIQTGEFTLTNRGTLTNNGTINGNLVNEGTLHNPGAIDGTLTNNSSLSNSGAIDATLTNTGNLNNSGTISGTLTNEKGLSNSGVIDATLTNNGTIINNGGTLPGNIDGDGVVKGETEGTVITADTKEWTTDWYIAKGPDPVRISGSVSISGDVFLKLEDGCDLTITGGIGVPEGSSLTIFGSDTGENMGKLYAGPTGGNDYAAIGGQNRWNGNSGRITIHGGYITAISNSEGGAGIGGGKSGTNGPIEITGGIIYATGGRNAAGIGSGQDRSATGSITISGEHTIVVAKGGSNSGVTIGRDGDVRRNGGWITENDSSAVYGNFTLPKSGTVPSSHTLTVSEGATLTIPTGVTLTLEGDLLNRGTITGTIISSGTANNQGAMNGQITNNGSLTNSGTMTGQVTNSADGILLNTNSGAINGTVENGGLLDNFGTIDNTLTNTGTLSNGGTITGTVTNDSGIIINGGTLPDGVGGTVQGADNAKEVQETDTEWTSGWYIAHGEVTIDSRVLVKGGVHLMLADDCHLTVKGGINVDEGNSITVYSQSTGERMGRLTAGNERPAAEGGAGIGGGNGKNSGSIIIKGGNITANGGSVLINFWADAWRDESAAGIGGGWNASNGPIVISGGIVTASSPNLGAGIGGGQHSAGGDISITGGTVTASGGIAGIGGYGSGNITIRNAQVDCTGREYYSTGLGSEIYDSRDYDCGDIVIENSTVNSRGGHFGGGIVAGRNGHTGKIVIRGSEVSAIVGEAHCAIGGSQSDITIEDSYVYSYSSIGYSIGGYGAKVAINSGYVEARGGMGGINGTLTMNDPNGSPIIVSSVSDGQNKSAWRGLVLEYRQGEIYGGAEVTLDRDLELSDVLTLNIPEGSKLTLGQDVTLTNRGTITVGGTLDYTKGYINNFGSITTTGNGTITPDETTWNHKQTDLTLWVENCDVTWTQDGYQRIYTYFGAKPGATVTLKATVQEAAPSNSMATFAVAQKEITFYATDNRNNKRELGRKTVAASNQEVELSVTLDAADWSVGFYTITAEYTGGNDNLLPVTTAGDERLVIQGQHEPPTNLQWGEYDTSTKKATISWTSSVSSPTYHRANVYRVESDGTRTKIENYYHSYSPATVTLNDPGNYIFVVEATSVSDGDGSHSNMISAKAESEVLHIHGWSNDWASDDTHHWHPCSVANCTVTEDSQKPGYVAHTDPGDDGDCMTAVKCTVCQYELKAAQTEHSYGNWKSTQNAAHTGKCTHDGCNANTTGNCDRDGTAGVCSKCGYKWIAISAQPQGQTVSMGTDATFRVTATGDKVESYQWQISTNSGSGWTDISGATAQSYTVAAAKLTMNGNQYRCVVSNSGDSAASDAATLTVQEKPEEVPNIQINYKHETLTGFISDGSYTIGGSEVTPTEDGTLAAADYFGQTISIVKKGDQVHTVDSTAQSLTIPSRNTAPAENSFTVTQPSVIGGTGSIEGIASGMEYSTDDGASWTAGTGSEVTGLAGGTVCIVCYKPTDSSFRSAPYSVSITTFEGTPETQPDIKINFESETLTGFAAGGSYAIDGAEVTPENDGTLAAADYFGQTISIVKKGDQVHTVDSAAQSLPVPARPNAPSGLQGVNTSFAGENDGSITGVSADMEYRKSGEERWTDCGGTNITGLSAGTYQVRLKATARAFAGNTADVSVASGEERTYTLNVTAPAFDTVTYGYTQPDAKAIIISSSGNSDSTISSVIVSDSSTFTIDGSGSTVTAHGSINTYTIRPAADLGRGVYKATITVTYNGGATATAEVTFTVKGASQDAPSVPVEKGKTYNSVTLEAVADNANGAKAQYSKDNGATWQDSPEFTGLSPSTEYTFVVRYGEIGNYEASLSSPSTKITTSAAPSGGGGGGYTPPATYPPTVEKPSEGGDVTIKPSNPSTGDKVTITPKPDTGHEVDQITVTDQNSKPVNVTKNPDGTYTFTQPSGKVTIRVTYKPTETPWNNPFTDVSEGDWYYEAVRFVHERGLMGGYGNGLFGPNNNLSRAQLAQILFNKEGRPGVNYLMDFSDVSGEAWYAEAVRWAAAMGIVGGYGNGKFGPNDPITREQLAVMLWRYAGSPAATNKELHFADADEANGYALDALLWAVENGILNGYGDERLNPGGLATRAQVAQMLKNFMESQEDNI